MFLPLLLKMTGLYACIGMGFIAARRLHLQREGVSLVLFHLIVPLMFLSGISRIPLSGALILLPLVIMIIASILGLLGFAIALRLWPEKGDKTANILGFTAGNGNMGYFGIPVALMIFERETVGLYMLMILGVIFFEATLGYALATRGEFSLRQAAHKMATMPMLHGALLGMVMALLGWKLPAFTDDFFTAIRGTYSVLGMMMVGMGLAGIQRFTLDGRFLAVTFGMKFIVWPLVMGGFVWLDAHHLHLFTHTIHDAMMLLSLAPLAVMSVIFATMLNAQPEKMATAVFLSTCFALVYVPLMISWLGLGG